MDGISVGMVHYKCYPEILRLSVESVLKKTDNLEELIIAYYGSNKDREYIPKSDKIRVIKCAQVKPGASSGKGEGLNILQRQFKTKYAAFVENDGFIIKNHWDTLLIEYMKQNGKIVMGCELPLKPPQIVTGSFSLFSIFDNDKLKEYKIDWMPQGEGPNFTWKYDTGSRLIGIIPEELAEKFPFASGRRGDAVLFKIVGTGEFSFQGEPIFAHFSRGASSSPSNTVLNRIRNWWLSKIHKVSRNTGRVKVDAKIVDWCKICKGLL